MTEPTQTEQLVRSTQWFPAYDKRDPCPSKNYGIGAATLVFIVSGKAGAVNLTIYTGWYLKSVREEFGSKGWRSDVMAIDLGVHSHTPQYPNHTVKTDCYILQGDCYYDGSTLGAEEPFELLLSKGSDALWEYLENYYREQFK